MVLHTSTHFSNNPPSQFTFQQNQRPLACFVYYVHPRVSFRLALTCRIPAGIPGMLEMHPKQLFCSWWSVHAFDCRRLCGTWGGTTHLFNIRVCLDLLVLSHTPSLDAASYLRLNRLTAFCISSQYSEKCLHFQYLKILSSGFLNLAEMVKSFSGCPGTIALTYDNLLKLFTVDASAIHSLRPDKIRRNKA